MSYPLGLMRPFHPLKPVIIGCLLGCLLATPVILTDNRADDAEHKVDAVVEQAEKQHQDDLRRITELEADLATERRANNDLQAQFLRAAEASRAAKVRASRSRHATPVAAALPRHSTPVTAAEGFAAWLNSAKARSVYMCESGGNPKAVNPAGYYGKWQFDLRTWRSVGGTGNPINASEDEQDRRAYRLWQSRGWSPWGCA